MTDESIIASWMADISRRLGRMEATQDGMVLEVSRLGTAVQIQNGNVAKTVALVAEIDGRLGVHLTAHKDAVVAAAVRAGQDGAYRSGYAQGEQAFRARWMERGRRFAGFATTTGGVLKMALPVIIAILAWIGVEVAF